MNAGPFSPRTSGVPDASGHGRRSWRGARPPGEKTPADADVPAELIELILDVGRDHTYGEASHAVIGLPGDVDYHAGRLLRAPNLPPGWPDLLACDLLSERLGLATHLANDADLAAVGEAAYGAGRDSEAVADLTISTGIDEASSSGRLVRGMRSLGEVGHTVIDWQAWRALRPNTLEELGSGSGVARLAREAGLGELDADAIGLWRLTATRRRSGSGRRDRRPRHRRRERRDGIFPQYGDHRRRDWTAAGLLRPTQCARREPTGALSGDFARCAPARRRCLSRWRGNWAAALGEAD